MFIKALVVLASITAGFARPYITQPVATTTFHGGQSATVSWQDDGKTPTLANYGPCKISIYAGNAQQQTLLQTLSSSVDVSKASSVDAVIDATIGPNSSQYFIRLESLSAKDPDTPQYAAMAFSSKFTLDNMTGTFNTTVQNQINGQSTAPLASPTGATTPSGSSGASPSPTTSGFTTSTSKKPSSTSVPSSTSKSSAADSIMFHGSWIGFILSAFFGVALL